MDCKTHLKNSIKKIEETVEPKVKLPHLNRKPIASNKIFFKQKN